MDRPSTIWTAGVAAGVALVAGGASLAAAALSSPRVLNHDVLNVRLAGNARGAQAFLWTTTTDRGVQIGRTRWEVSYPRARLRLPDGRLTRPQTLTRTRAIAAGARAIGLDARGAATALWTEVRPRHRSLRVSLRPPGGRFSAGVEIGRPSPSEDPSVALAVAPTGAAVIAWTRGNATFVLRRPAGRCAPGRPRACFGSVQRIPDRCPAGLRGCVGDTPGLALAIAPDGRAYLAWTAVRRTRDAFRTVIRLAVTPAARRFGRPRTVSRAAEVSTDPAIAVTRAGGAALAWVGHRPGGPRAVVAALGDDRGRVTGLPQTLSPRGCSDPLLRVNSGDETSVAWTCRDRTLGAAVRLPGAPFVAAPPMPDRDVTSADLALDGHGNTLLLYVTGETILARVRPPGGAFGDPIRVAGGIEVRAVEAGLRLSVLRSGRRENTALLGDWTP